MKIERLKEEISVEEVLTYLGGSIVGGGYGTWEPCTCPFHDDQEASASVNRASGYFLCHACDAPDRSNGKAGDIIDMAKAHLGTNSLKEATAWLEREFL